MLKIMARLEHKIGDRIYHLICDSESPTVEIKDALSTMLGYVVNVENNSKAQAEAKAKKADDLADSFSIHQQEQAKENSTKEKSA